MATKSHETTSNSAKRKQKEKSGYEKRKEKRQRDFKESCNAQGQTFLTNYFTSKNTVLASDATATNDTVEHGVLHDLHHDGVGLLSENTAENVVEFNLNQFNETTPTAVAGSSLTSIEKAPNLQNNDEWYKGKKINLEWLLQAHQYLSTSKKKYGDRLRPSVACSVCAARVEEIKRFSSNGKVPLAQGVRADGKDRVMRIIDHLDSDMHKEALRLDEHERNWASMSDHHPWARILNKTNWDTKRFLVCLAVDVYNDSLVETLSARSWPSRSLSSVYANNMLEKFEEKGWDTTDISFNPSSAMCHYRSPIIYAEMLEVIADIQRRHVFDVLHDSLCYSVQIDGSMDKQQQDCKFVSARYVPKNEVSVESVFVGVVCSENSGAEGLLDSLCNSLENIKQSKKSESDENFMDKLIGISTDGESANTGSKGGLWELLKEKLERKLITMWCVCHRSDLAYESVHDSVPELKYWMVDVKAVANFFRASAVRTKELHKIDKKCLVYPRHFEVRFAEHICQLLKAVLHNLDASREVWTAICQKQSGKTEVQQAAGFCNKWKTGSRQVWLTALMFDVCTIFKELQKKFQKSQLIILEVMTARETALRELNLMKEGPIAGGMEEKHTIKVSEDHTSRHSRSHSAIRSEILLSAINFLGQRLQMEDDGTVANFTTILKATSAKEIIDASRQFICDLFGVSKLREFTSDVCKSFGDIEGIKNIDSDDSGTVLALRLRKMIQVSQGLFKKLLASFFAVTPHSMGTERVVSHYNRVKTEDRTSLKLETINNILHISLNGKGTVFFDPREAVAEFLKRKERRNSTPDTELFKCRDYMKKFFRDSSGCL